LLSWFCYFVSTPLCDGRYRRSIFNPILLTVNVAGESKNLDPNGEDVLGINIPFGEFLNAGSFETTYLDDSMRVSRSKTGPTDQIRVFVKIEKKESSEGNEQVVVEEDELDDELDDDEIVDEDELPSAEDSGAIDAVIDEKNESSADEEDDEILPEAPSDIEN